MRLLLKSVALVAILIATPALAAHGGRHHDTSDPALAPAREMIAAVNKGDMAAAAKFYAPSAAIVDEFPPYQWGGANAFGGWSDAFVKELKQDGVTDPRVMLGAVVFENAAPDAHYAVFKARITSMHNGKPSEERGLFTFTTVKTADGWRISSWTWSTLKPGQ